MKKFEKPRYTSGRDARGFSFKYYPIKGDDKHRLAVPGGRCKCGKITDAYCDDCNDWICEGHMVEGKEDGECYCKKCGDGKA